MRVTKRINWALTLILRRKSPRVNFSNPNVCECVRLMRVCIHFYKCKTIYTIPHTSNACLWNEIVYHRWLSLHVCSSIHTFDNIVIQYFENGSIVCRFLLLLLLFLRWSSRQWFVFIILKYPIKTNMNTFEFKMPNVNEHIVLKRTKKKKTCTQYKRQRSSTHAMWEMSITRITLVCFIRVAYSIYSEMRRPQRPMCVSFCMSIRI